MITGSRASSVVTAQRGSCVMLAILRDWPLLLNHSAAPSHTPHTGMTCGRPSGQVVATQ